MSALPTPLAARIAKLIGRLGSSHDGEIVATGRAIERVLKGEGHDLHDLAIHIEAHPPSPRTVYRDRPAESSSTWGGTWHERHERAGPRSFGDWREAWARDHRQRWFTPKQEAEQRRQIIYCLRNSARLGRYECEFINSISRDNGGLSLAQASWLADIVDRLDSEARCA